MTTPAHARAAFKAIRYTCGGCDNTWSGLNPCHCSRCHRTFGGSSLFDRHQGGGRCVDPAILRSQAGALVMKADASGIWRDARAFDSTKVFGRKA